jgi:hypothetical protein
LRLLSIEGLSLTAEPLDFVLLLPLLLNNPRIPKKESKKRFSSGSCNQAINPRGTGYPRKSTDGAFLKMRRHARSFRTRDPRGTKASPR